VEVIDVSFVDKTLTCKDCGASFTFSAGEQEFHAQKGFTYPPGRCPACRARRRSERGDYASSTGGYGGAGERREMFSATCSECGKEARVPFQPRDDRPVYCADCFRNHQGTASGSSSRGGYSGGRSSRW
jgi:CxxC-x17-CxxC domain-containing protein